MELSVPLTSGGYTLNERIEQRFFLSQKFQLFPLTKKPAAHEPRRIEHAHKSFASSGSGRPEWLKRREFNYIQR